MLARGRYLRGLRRRGGRLVTGAEPRAIAGGSGGWEVQTAGGTFVADILVNAAGAWVAEIARLAGVAPLGLVARRRTALRLDPPAGLDPTPWPMVIDADERFYFKPEAGKLLVSPADETPVEPCDVQPEALDVAITVDPYQSATGHKAPRISRRWAGQRAFVGDHDPVVGRDPAAPEFVWLAGQGGAGIMTAPALAQIAAGLILDGRAPAALGPARLRAG